MKRDLASQMRKDRVVFMQLWFSDLHGNLKRKTMSVNEFVLKRCEGSWFDGSSIEGFSRIEESDARLLPDEATYAVIPWTPKNKKTARIICDVLRPDGQTFGGDPRAILKKVLSRAREKGFIYNVGPEVEFFLLEETQKEFAFHDRAGYFDATGDLAEGFRHDVMLRLDEMGIEVEMGHHEVAPGQHEIDIKYNDALTMADSVMTLKHVIERTARDLYKLRATFMPKPLAGINGSGMHTHQSLFDLRGNNVFYDPDDPYRLSKIAYHFIAGQIQHIKALAAIVAPTVNSYKRLVPGYEAPTYICWARKNRAALIRIPAYTPGKDQSIRCELRCPDPSSNPYFAFAAMLSAGLDGIEKEMRIPDPIEEDVFHFTEAELAKRGVDGLPDSLNKALEHLEKDEVVLGALGSHTAAKFLEAKRKEWLEYVQFCGSEEQAATEKVTDWEIRKYLFGGFDETKLVIKKPAKKAE